MTKLLLMIGMYAKFSMIILLRRILALKIKRMMLHSTKMMTILLITIIKISFMQFDIVDESTGPDIPTKLVKLGLPVLASIISKVMSYSISMSNFPPNLKMGNLSPVYKKNDNMSKGNYRPVSVLPTISKIFEGILADQLSNFLETVSHPFTATFRKHPTCQSVLIRFIGDWKQALDQNKYVAAILMGLSKVFDYLPLGLSFI